MGYKVALKTLPDIYDGVFAKIVKVIDNFRKMFQN